MPRHQRGPYAKNYLVRHRNGFRYRRPVPLALRPLLSRAEWSLYLGQVSFPEAEMKARALAVEHDRQIAALCRLTESDRKALATVGGTSAFAADVAALERSLPFVEAVSTHFDDSGLDLEDADQATEALEIAKSRQAGAKRRDEITRGKRLLAAASGKRADDHALKPLLDAWVKQNNPTAGTIDDNRRRLSRFAAHVGTSIAPRQVTRAHVQSYRDALQVDPRLTKRTARSKHLETLVTLFNVGMSVGLVDANPALRVKLPDDNTYELGKQPFSGDQVALIFDRMRELCPDFQWMLRLLAYHGCRSGELAPLRGEDVATLANVTVLRLHGRVKNRQSVRDVPLHPKCVDFVDFVKERAKTGERVFSSLPLWKGSYAEKFQKDVNLWLRAIGLTDAKLTVHSLRRTWITYATEIGMPDAVAKSITGHSLGADEHSAYKNLPSLKLRAKWIGRVDPLKA